MATTIAFDLITQLAVVCRAQVSPGTIVYDGPGVSNDPGNFLMVGVGDPDSNEPSESAAGTQEWSGLGAKAARESGTVTCCALAWSGDTGDAAQQAARESVRDIVADVDLALRADPNLGGAVPGLMWVRYGRNYRLTQLSAGDGVAALLYFEVAYEARLV
jgi:hypothetical protein